MTHLPPRFSKPILWTTGKVCDKCRAMCLWSRFRRNLSKPAFSSHMPIFASNWTKIGSVVRFQNGGRGGGRGGRRRTQFVHGRSHMTIDPRIPTIPGRSTTGFHQPGTPGGSGYFIECNVVLLLTSSCGDPLLFVG